MRGNVEQEVQQSTCPPHNRRDARPQVQQRQAGQQQQPLRQRQAEQLEESPKTQARPKSRGC
jgi:hypothetical protein